MRRLHNKVIQLSSYHLTNKEVHYVHTAESQDNILPRGGPIQDPYPLSWKKFPHKTKLYSKKLYSERVTQLHSHHTANKKNTICTNSGSSLRESFENVRV